MRWSRYLPRPSELSQYRSRRDDRDVALQVSGVDFVAGSFRRAPTITRLDRGPFPFGATVSHGRNPGLARPGSIFSSLSRLSSRRVTMRARGPSSAVSGLRMRRERRAADDADASLVFARCDKEHAGSRRPSPRTADGQGRYPRGSAVAAGCGRPTHMDPGSRGSAHRPPAVNKRHRGRRF